MLTTALCFLYLSMRPPQKPADQIPPAADAMANSDDPLMQPAPNPNDASPSGSPEDAGAETDSPSAVASFPERLVTLGSMDPEKGYNLLVTLSSHGAGVEEAELVAQSKPGKFRYRALEHKGGYLGHLGLVETVAGLRIRTIPDGSPASLASSSDGDGLEIGDVISRADFLPKQTVRTAYVRRE